MAASVYNPLDSLAGQVRFLKIHPTKKESDKISCELIYHFLKDSPEYEALSYTWGLKPPVGALWKSISLNSMDFPVLDNVLAALLRLRQPSKPRVIWIDAICINQNDVQEKEEQILLMRKIYEQAQQVRIWLGETGTGERIAMQSLANPSGSFSLGVKVWRAEGQFGLRKSLKHRMGQNLTGEWDANAMDVGELAQLLDRPWWRRVWIVQEVVLAKKAIFMCGPDEVPWEAIKARTRDGVYGILGQDLNQALRHTEEGSVVAKYAFPNNEYILLSGLQEKWRSRSVSGPTSWNETLYSLLYKFRRFECTRPRDRIYAFLGLANDIKDLDITPDYTSSTSKVFTNVARGLIVSHKHLLVFNLKREPVTQQQATRQQSQIYSLPDQARFFDPEGLVVEGVGKLPRKGWTRLPHGWERRLDGSRFRFYNHFTGKYQDASPLKGQAPPLPQKMEHWRSLPQGWKKDWDNVGNVKYFFDPDNSKHNAPKDTEDYDLKTLPSWVPDWTKWSTKDPEPFPSLTDEEPRYWASGPARTVHFASGYDSDSNTLKLTGVLFDKIEQLAPAWCTEPHLLPIDRSENKILQEWEALGTTPVPNCPYAESGGRYEAFWRTSIADYAGTRKATENDKTFFEMWANRGVWASRVEDNFNTTDKSSWQKHYETATEQRALSNMVFYVRKKAYADKADSEESQKEIRSRYKEVRQRVYDACVGRSMFVTAKGYIGLAPWNAQKGDVASVLLGGATPFILREVPGKEHYSLVGESYIYGIMGGELFDGKMGHARLRAFDII